MGEQGVRVSKTVTSQFACIFNLASFPGFPACSLLHAKSGRAWEIKSRAKTCIYANLLSCVCSIHATYVGDVSHMTVFPNLFTCNNKQAGKPGDKAILNFQVPYTVDCFHNHGYWRALCHYAAYPLVNAHVT